jgi:hypothetical protein
MTESAFSSSAQEVIQRPLVIENDETRTHLSTEQFNDYYELGWTANEIISKNYTRVSAPSSLLAAMTRTLPIDCPPISRRTFARFRPNLS